MILICYSIFLLFILVWLIRNNWVYTQRIKLISTDFNKYKSLPSYHTMLLKFWIWNIEKFVIKPKEI